ncbi:MAG: ATP-binding protein [Gemmataceae bacterium]
MGDSPPLTLTIPSNLRLMPLVHVYLEAVCEVGELDPDATHAVVLATGEAVQNIIRHAHRHCPQASLQIQCSFREDGVEIVLSDEGEPFDVSSVPHLDPAELRIGGRGVFLMRSLMDELHCLPRCDKGNHLRMFKRCRCRFTVTEITDGHDSGDADGI